MTMNTTLTGSSVAFDAGQPVTAYEMLVAQTQAGEPDEYTVSDLLARVGYARTLKVVSVHPDCADLAAAFGEWVFDRLDAADAAGALERPGKAGEARRHAMQGVLWASVTEAALAIGGNEQEAHQTEFERLLTA